MRISFNIALIVSILYLPWWFSALLALAACFIIERFYEVVIYGILVDALYGSRMITDGFAYVGSLYSVCLFSVSLFLRDKLSW